MKFKILLPVFTVIVALAIAVAGSAFTDKKPVTKESKAVKVEKNLAQSVLFAVPIPKRPASAMFFTYNPLLPQSSRTSYTKVDNPGEDPCPGSEVLCGIWVLPSSGDSHPDATAFNNLKANPTYYNSTTQQFIENPGIVEFREQ